MNPKIMKHRFEKKESGYHKFAVKELAAWVNGLIEQPFYIDSEIAFVPDISVYKNGILTSIFEVVCSHPIPGRKIGTIQMWCYFNNTELSVFEVSSDWILKQTEKPDRIINIDYYNINPF